MFFLASAGWASVMSNGSTEIRNDSLNIGGFHSRTGGIFSITDSISQASGVGASQSGPTGSIRGFAAMLDEPPFAPSTFTAVAVSSTQINWLWNDRNGWPTSEDAVEFRDGSANLLLTFAANTTSHLESGLIANTTSTRQIWFVNGFGIGKSVVLSKTLAAPAALSITSGEGTLHGINHRLTLAWNMVDPDGDPLTYTVFFGSFSPPGIATATAITDSFVTVGPLAYGVPYFWRVEGVDPFGNTTLGAIKTFTLANRNPNDPIISEGMSGSITTSFPELQLRWSVDDPDGDALTSSLSVAEGNVGLSLGAASFSPLASPRMAIVFEGSEQTWLLQNLKFFTPYTWQVTGKDNAGGTKSSQVKKFILIPPGSGRVKAVKGRFRFSEGLELGVNVQQAPANIRIIIESTNKVVVGEEAFDGLPDGWTTLRWDGKVSNGKTVFSGNYVVYVFENEKLIGAIPVAGRQ